MIYFYDAKINKINPIFHAVLSFETAQKWIYIMSTGFSRRLITCILMRCKHVRKKGGIKKSS